MAFHSERNLHVEILDLAGVYSGYFMCFALEFVIVKFETDLEYIKNKQPKVSHFHVS